MGMRSEPQLCEAPLSVVHISSVHRSFDTRIFEKECRTLGDRGHRVVLVTPHPRTEVRNHIHIRALSQPANRFARMIFTARRAVTEALEIGGDVYHLHDPELLPWWKCMADPGMKVVYDMHENLSAQIRTKEWLPRAARPLISFVGGLFLKGLLDDIPVIFAERSYKEDFPWVDESVTVQNMPRLDRMDALQQPRFDDPTIGYVGGVTRDRGSVVTLQALARLQQRGRRVEWECVGPVSERHRKKLEHLSRELGVEGVRWRGYLPPQEAWSRMARCHVGLAVLRPVPNYVRSYPTKLFEYMALGLPVVASDVPLYREVVEDVGCGVLVDPDDPEDVADGIARILEHDEESRQMARRGRFAVRDHYNWAAEGDRLLQFYERILASGS